MFNRNYEMKENESIKDYERRMESDTKALKERLDRKQEEESARLKALELDFLEQLRIHEENTRIQNEIDALNNMNNMLFNYFI